MLEERRREYEDRFMVRFIKDFWPIIGAFIACTVTYGRFDNRVARLEEDMRTKTPIISDTSTRVTRLETLVLNMQSDIRDIKLDVKTLVNRSARPYGRQVDNP